MPNMGFRPMEVHTLKASRIRLSIATNANQGATVLEPSDFTGFNGGDSNVTFLDSSDELGAWVALGA